MKAFLTFCTMCMLLFQVMAQGDLESVPFVAYWNKGDVFHYKVTKIKYRENAGVIQENDSTVYKATFTVADSTASTYKILWSIEKPEAPGYETPTPGEVAITPIERMDVMYTTTETGTFIGIENWEEVGEKLKQDAKKEIAERLNISEEDTARMKALVDTVVGFYTSKEGVEKFAFPELMLMHYAMGAELMVKDTLFYDDYLPNILGGDPIKGTNSFYFKEIDFDLNYCVLEQKTTIDPEDARKIVNSIIEMGNYESEMYEQMLSKVVFDVSGLNQYAYNFEYGIPLFFESTRNIQLTIDVYNSVQRESVIVKMVE